MKPFTIKTFLSIIEHIGCRHPTAMLKRILSPSATLIRKISRFCRWVIQTAFAQETATVSIDGNNVRFLVTNGKRVILWESIVIGPGIVREGLILNPPLVSAAISDLIASKRLKKGKVGASLSGIQAVHRIIELPKMPKRLLGEAIVGEAKKAMSISLEKTYLSWHCISKSEDAVQRFFLLGVPKNIMDAEVQCLLQAGMRPRSMSLKPVALANMIGRNEATVIDVEPESCTIIVIADGVPIIMRSLVMSSSYSPLERAQHVLKEYERTLQFYKSSYLDKPPNPAPLFLTGGLAGDNELRQSIASGAGHNFGPLDCPLQYPPGFSPAEFAVNIGLTLKGASPVSKQFAQYSPPLVTNFDILPDLYRAKGFPARQILFVAGVVVGIALMLPLYQLANGATFAANQRQTEKNLLSQNIVLRQTQNKEAGQIKDSIAIVKSRQQNLLDISNDIQKLQDRRSRAYDLLYISAVGVLPANVTLRSIAEEEGKLSLACQASSYDAALGYADALRKTEGFSDVQVHSLKRMNDDGEAAGFTISLKWK